MALSKWVAVIGMLAFGTVSSIMSKVNFEVRGVNLNGKVVPFHKPWFCVLVMFVGMSGCLLLFVSSLVSPLLARPAKAKESRKYKKLMTDNPSLGGEENAYLQALIDNTEPSEEQEPEGGSRGCTWGSCLGMLMIAIPSALNLVATVLMSIGLLYVTVSIYQMMRGAELVFAAIFSVLFLGKKLYKLHYVGIACAVVGISMVGIASILSPEQNDTGTKAQQVLGISLIVLAQAIQAGQICFEEHFMKSLDFMKPTVSTNPTMARLPSFSDPLSCLPSARGWPGGPVRHAPAVSTGAARGPDPSWR